MLASLLIPAIFSRPRTVELQQFPTAAAGSTVVFHPRFASWLRRAGLDSAPAIFALRGEIVCGHPDRHVARIELPNGRIVFLKREHVVGSKTRFKNWRAGFGPISRCEREAITLQELEEAGLPGPQWLAYGTSGDGRSFLLIDHLAGSCDVADLLGDKTLSLAERRFVATRIGATLAEYHDAGYATPDLSAKHVFLAGPARAVTVIDWQSTPAPGPVAWSDRVKSLARLDASIPQSGVRERFALLRSYLISCAGAKPKFADLVRKIDCDSPSQRRRSSSLAQRQTGAAIRLVWLDDECIVTIPELAKHWPSALEEAETGQYRRIRNFAPFGRLWAHLRNVPWRSPAAHSARLLAQLQRANLPAPRLLAYGQTLEPFARSTSFLLTDRPSDAVPFAAALPASGDSRVAFLKQCGRFLKSLHQSGAAIRNSRTPSILVSHGSLFANAPDGVVRAKRVGFFRALRDLRVLLNGLGRSLDSRDRSLVVLAYFDGAIRSRIRRYLVARLVRGGTT